jgi:NAD(P)-dependent dehydrogenase (short-subunit alcohol dehydrogenase family)
MQPDRRAMTKTIVITGSTRGIGFGMAVEFLRRGHTVVVNGRRPDVTDQAVAQLAGLGLPGAALAMAGDVSKPEDVEALWAAAVGRSGRVDIWINNAGLINRYRPVGDLSDSEITGVVAANLTGTIHCCNVAVREMRRQAIKDGLRGAIYNFEGFGSDGMTRGGMSVYGSTKRAITYFTKTLVKEQKHSGVVVGYIQPGIVITDLGLGEAAGKPAADLRREKKFIMMFGDPVGPVAAYIVPRVLSNSINGARINWLSLPKLLWRLATAKVTGRDPFAAAEMN